MTVRQAHDILAVRTRGQGLTDITHDVAAFVRGSGITDGLLFDGVKFESDCVRTSSLVISTLDNTARFTNTIHIKDGAKSIALR